jgi:thiol-disulfide isomerase/thioredoxin
MLLIPLLALAVLQTPAVDHARADSYPLLDLKTGKHTTLAKLKGHYKAIFIDSYASWCPDCRRAQPEVLKLRNEMKGQKVLFVGLDVWDDLDKIKKHQAENHLPYLILHDEGGSHKPHKPGITDFLGITNIPTVLVLDGKTLQEKGRFVDEKSVHFEDEKKLLTELSGR